MSEDWRGDVAWAAEQCCKVAERLGRLLEQQDVPAWAFPVGTDEYPPERWYAATLHDTTGVRNGGYAHIGVDENLDVPNWGDVDRGQPVFCVAPGVVQVVGYSSSYLGSVIIEVQHQGYPLYVRYWHLADDGVFRGLAVGQAVEAGQQVGAIGNYRLGAGGDHLHLDCARDLFGAHWWFTKHPDIRWIDPVPVLSWHLDAVAVEAMLQKGA